MFVSTFSFNTVLPRAIGASSSGLRSSFAARTVGDWNQLPAVVVEQESPAAFKNQLDRLAPVACRNAPPPAIGAILHEAVLLKAAPAPT